MGLRKAWVFAAAFVAAPLAQAQTAVIEPSDALRCLTPVAADRGTPEYPFAAWKAGRAGVVHVELVFNAPDRPPTIEIRLLEGAAEDRDEFVAEVRKHVGVFRVPCFRDGQAAVRLRQEYVFRPDQRKVHWSHVRDAADDAQRPMLACVKHLDGSKMPTYPTEALRTEVSGRVLVNLRFTAPDRAPEAQVFARKAHGLLKRSTVEWVQGLRMPCYSGEPFNTGYTFVFVMTGSPYGFKPLLLQHLVGAVRDIGRQRFTMDTGTMGCPFDLQFTYRQPDQPNLVGEVGGSDPARRPLMDWLATAELELPVRTLDAIYGDTTTITVPCLQFDLKPKE